MLDDPASHRQLLTGTHLLLPLPLVVALERDTSQETRYTLLHLHPIPHQLRKFLRTALALRNKLHLCPSATRTAGGRLKDKGGAEVILRRDAHLPVVVKRDLDAQDGRERLAELGRLGRKDLAQPQQPLLLLAQVVLQLRFLLADG